MQTIQIMAKTISHMTYTMNCELQDTVYNLKQKIQDFSGNIIESQTLFFKGSILMDGHTLADYAFKDGDSVYLVLSVLRSG